jgi:rhodanese-related sulfurtransferase
MVVLLADAGWFGAAAALALAVGVTGDRLFRELPLGLSYRSTPERVLAAGTAITLVSLEEVESLLGRPETIVLDARPRVFFELGHLPGALSLSREAFEHDFAALETVLRSPRKSLLIYCSDLSCEDGARVARALQQRGFESLAVFPGGVAEWEAAGKTLEVTP